MSDIQAETYSKNSHIQTRDGLSLISKTCLQEGMKVLDLGCGTGYLSSILAKMVGTTGEVIGIDPDVARINLAQGAYKAVSNLSFKEGSTQNIPEREYDMVFSNYVFHWVEDKEVAFRNIFDCLKPEGTFALCLETGLLKDIEDLINLLQPERKQVLKKHLFYQSVEEIREIARLSGFTVRYSSEMEAKGSFECFDDFLQCSYGGFSGLVDPKKMDAEGLQQLKGRIGDENLELEICTIACFIFSKTINQEDIM